MLTEGDNVPQEFSRPEVLAILKQYYSGFEKKAEIH
jgi:ATP sulfurylase